MTMMLELALFDVYRVLRSDGMFWLDWTTLPTHTRTTFAPMLGRVGFKHGGEVRVSGGEGSGCGWAWASAIMFFLACTTEANVFFIVEKITLEG
jgi:hypothetical protein